MTHHDYSHAVNTADLIALHESWHITLQLPEGTLSRCLRPRYKIKIPRWEQAHSQTAAAEHHAAPRSLRVIHPPHPSHN